MMGTWHLRRVAIACVAAGAVALAGCSSEQEGSDTTASTTSGGCEPSAEATAAYEQAWEQGEQAFGLEGVEIPEVDICMVDTSEYATEPGEDGYRVAFAAQGPTNSWAVENEEAFMARAEERGVEVVYASANGDAAKQVDNIQQLRSQSPDAMVVVPMGSGITGQVQATAAKGIPVVLCAGRLGPDSGAVSTVTRSYELQGILWAEWVAQQTGGEGRIAMLSGIAGVPTAEAPKAAAEKLFAEKYPDIEIVAKEYTDWSPTKAKTVAASLVDENLDAIWSDSSFSALGVYEAYRQAGKPVPPVTGDASNGYVKTVIDEPRVKFALSPFPPEQSAQCLDVALDVLEGTPVPNIVNVEAPAFTHKDAEQYVRPECSDNLWIPTSLPDALLRKLDLC